jgi:hypothetical protein
MNRPLTLLFLFHLSFTLASWGAATTSGPHYKAGEGCAIRYEEHPQSTELWLEQGEDSVLLNTPGSILRGDPAIAGKRIAWIEEHEGRCGVRLRSGTETLTLYEGEAATCLDVAVGAHGAAWSCFLDSDWDIACWSEGKVRVFSNPGTDEVQSTVGDKEIAWISSTAMEVWGYVASFFEEQPERLPGWFASDVSFHGEVLSWMGRVREKPAFYLRDAVASRMVSDDIGLLPLFRKEVQRIDPEVRTHPAVSWTRIPTDHAAWPRTTHATVALGDGKTLIFSGEIENPQTRKVDHLDSQVWVFDPKVPDWSLLEFDREPSPRCHAPMALDPERNRVLLWGGGGLDESNRLLPLDDTWILDLEKNQWHEVAGGPNPGRGSDAGMIFVPSLDKYLLHHHGEIWLFDPNSETWEQRKTFDNPPTRTSSALVYDASRNRAILYGGALHPRYFGDTWSLDLETWRWKEIRSFPHPEARVRSAMAVDPDSGRVLLYGGVRGPYSQRYSDLWALDLATDTWQLLENDNPQSPGARGGFLGTAFHPETGLLTLFGGRSSVEGHHNDTWNLRVEKHLGSTP